MDAYKLYKKITEEEEISKNNTKHEMVYHTVEEIIYVIKKERLEMKGLYDMVNFLIDGGVNKSYFYDVVRRYWKTEKDERGKEWLLAREKIYK